MPVFEYLCNECNTKYDIYHKSTSNPEEVKCPKCESKDHKKLLSSFSASVSAESSYDSCASGNCGIPSGGGCASGMCGLN